MGEVNIIHISDLHFAARDSSLTPVVALRLAIQASIPHTLGAPTILAISGDVTNRGEQVGFDGAQRALAEHQSTLQPESIVFCPGNHDISGGTFDAFNQFVFRVTNDSQMRWSTRQPVVSMLRQGYHFVLVNSYFEADHAQGRIPIDHLRNALQNHPGAPVIVLVHDSPISSRYGGQSLVDGYDLLNICAARGVTAILHGHVHSNQSLIVGRLGTLVAGTGSLGYKPDPNMNNHFAIYRFADTAFQEGLSFKYHENSRTFESTPMEMN
ncbi:metallophosphoesterase family protein [Aestuariimicrobium sp. Y1814]|uniref:metallophosphoesterase family protein n=1 Tax=Aestuariimicrobium sp. Y1814 TaxID=3418742 RepID=UPI003DA76608